MHHTEKLFTVTPNLELLVITNHDPNCDTRLRFEFDRAAGAAARLWLFRLTKFAACRFGLSQVKQKCGLFQLLSGI
jgi:hypothetical protein